MMVKSLVRMARRLLCLGGREAATKMEDALCGGGFARAGKEFHS